MVSAISNAGPGYIGPSRQVVQDRLLDERFAIVKRADEERLSRHSQKGEGMTITSDAVTFEGPTFSMTSTNQSNTLSADFVASS